jgi:hypothetical protein
MRTLIDRLKMEEDKLDQELEDSHGEYDKMKVVFEKKIQLYGRYLNKQEDFQNYIDSCYQIRRNGPCHTYYY